MTCAALLAAQDEAVSVDAADRERIRRVWFLAAQRERLTLADKLAGASLFDAPPPNTNPLVCLFPGCGRSVLRGRASRGALLCASHLRQKTRRGWLHVGPLGAPTHPPVRRHGAAFSCHRCGGARFRDRGTKGRSCMECEARRSRERRQRVTRDPNGPCKWGHAPNWTPGKSPKCRTCRAQGMAGMRARQVSA